MTTRPSDFTTERISWTVGSFVLPALKFSGLMHECFKTSQRIRLLLAVISHIENRDVMILLAIALQQGAHDRSGHAGKGHDIDDAACPSFRKIDRLSNGENGLSFKGGIEKGLCILEKDFRFGLPEVLEMALEYLFEIVLILFLVAVGEENLQEI